MMPPDFFAEMPERSARAKRRGGQSGFVRRGGYQVKVLIDEDGSAGEMYQARNLPVTYFMDSDGIIRDVSIGILSEKMLLEKIEKIIYNLE